MVCVAHNFKEIAKAIVTGLIRPEFGNFTANPAPCNIGKSRRDKSVMNVF